MSEKTKERLWELWNWVTVCLVAFAMCIGFKFVWEYIDEQMHPQTPYVDYKAQHKEAIKEAFIKLPLDNDLTSADPQWEQAYFDEDDNTTYTVDVANTKFIKLEQGKTLKVPVQKNINTGSDDSVFTYEYQFYVVDGEPMVKVTSQKDKNTITMGLRMQTVANTLFAWAHDYKMKHQ